MIFTDSHGNEVPLPPNTPVLERTSAYAVIARASQFLMVQSGNGLWHFPGGGVEQSESHSETAVRECLEETGYSIRVDDTDPIYERTQGFYHSREKAFYHSTQLFYSAALASDKPDVSAVTDHDKARRVDWLQLQELSDDNTHPTIHGLIEKLRN